MQYLLIPLGLLVSIAMELSAQQLNPGSPAPVFERTSVQGKKVSLDQYRGKKLLLAFFRYAGCPVCNFRMHELAEHYSQLQERNIEVIAVFESSNETLQAYLEDTKIPFAVVGDPELVLYQKYGVEKSVGKMLSTMFKKQPKQDMKQGKALFDGKKYKRDGSQTRIPADFVIDPTGKLAQVHYGTYIGDHLPLTVLLP